jgi:hypothetical protein
MKNINTTESIQNDGSYYIGGGEFVVTTTIAEQQE